MCEGESWTCVGTIDIFLPTKNNTDSETAGQVDVPTRVEVCVRGNPGHVLGPQTSPCLSKTTQTE